MTTSYPSPNDDLPTLPTAQDALWHSTLQQRIDQLNATPTEMEQMQPNNWLEPTDAPPRSTSHILPTHLSEHLAYSQFDTCKTLLITHQDRQVVVLCVAAGDVVPAHPSLQGTAISVLHGEGMLELAGVQTALVADVCVYIPAQAWHSIRATEDLSLLCAWGT